MNFAGEQLAAALFLSMANERIIEYLMQPICRKWPELDMWWVPYAVFITGFIIGFLSNINLFGVFMLPPLLQQILTAAVIGGGSELVHKVFGALDMVSNKSGAGK